MVATAGAAAMSVVMPWQARPFRRVGEESYVAAFVIMRWMMRPSAPRINAKTADDWIKNRESAFQGLTGKGIEACLVKSSSPRTTRGPHDRQQFDLLSNAIPGLTPLLVAFCFELLRLPPSHLARGRSVARLKETRVYFNRFRQRNPHGPLATKMN